MSRLVVIWDFGANIMDEYVISFHTLYAETGVLGCLVYVGRSPLAIPLSTRDNISSALVTVYPG
jgi:hypothetical protein